jgi:hypothetical protein
VVQPGGVVFGYAAAEFAVGGEQDTLGDAVVRQIVSERCDCAVEVSHEVRVAVWVVGVGVETPSARAGSASLGCRWRAGAPPAGAVPPDRCSGIRRPPA